MARAKEVLPEVSWASVRNRTDNALLEGRLQWLVDNGTYTQILLLCRDADLIL